MGILKIKNLTKKFGGIKAVSNFTVDIKKGTIAGLIGPNGAGKPTLFNLITGYLDLALALEATLQVVDLPHFTAVHSRNHLK